MLKAKVSDLTLLLRASEREDSRLTEAVCLWQAKLSFPALTAEGFDEVGGQLQHSTAPSHFPSTFPSPSSPA